MAAEIFTDLSKATDANDDPLAGAIWYFYDTGTTTPRAVYADAALGSSLGATVTADGNGVFVPIFFNADYIYKAVLKTAGGVTVKTLDPANGAVATVLASLNASDVAYVGGTDVQDELDELNTDLTALGVHLGANATVKPRSVEERLSDIVNVLDYMTSAEIADVKAYTFGQNVTLAIKTAAEVVQANDGGILWFPPGGYLVGLQTLGGTFLGEATVIAWAPSEVCTIKNCTRPVKISGYGAVIKAADGLRYGAFDPITGDPYASVTPFGDYDYYSYPYRGMINVEGNAAVTIEGFELDGNSTEMEIGGEFGDSNWQVEGHGMWVRDNGPVTIRDIYTHHQPGDGLTFSQPGLTEASAVVPIVIDNLVSRYNGRLAVALTGGKNVHIRNSDLSMTGQAVNTGLGAELRSSPGAGLDIEAESTVIRDVLIENTSMIGNWQVGMIAASGNSKRVTVNHCRIENAVLARPCYHFNDCTLIGRTNFVLAATDEYTALARAKYEGYRFTRCDFTYDPDLTELGSLINDSQSVWTEALFSIWSNCTISTRAVLLPASFKTLGLDSMVWENCDWTSSNSGTHEVVGLFRGTNRIVLSGGGATVTLSLGAQSVLEYGTLYVNGAAQGGNTYSISNLTTDRTYNADATSTAELADILGTFIGDVQAKITI